MKLSERITPGPWKLNERKDRLIGSNNEQVGFWGLYAYSPVSTPNDQEIANTSCMHHSAEMLSIIERLVAYYKSPVSNEDLNICKDAENLLNKLNS